MSNELICTLSNTAGRANDITHSLKEYGNGSMSDGILKLQKDSLLKGEAKCAYKVLAVMGVTLLCNILYDKIISKKPKLMSYKMDSNFPWEEVKGRIVSKYNISEVIFETWIQPLVCKAYEDVVFLEFSDSTTFKVDYLRNKYEGMIEDVVAEVTGKKYKILIIPQS